MAEITKRSVVISVADNKLHELTFSRELQHDHVNQFSVTITAPEQSWGEFFTKEDAALLYLWLGKQLRDIV